mgnify:CR=1 FL=1
MQFHPQPRHSADLLVLRAPDIPSVLFEKGTFKDVVTFLEKQSIAGDPEAIGVNFVTHSMGGILVRQYLANNQVPVERLVTSYLRQRGLVR